MSMSMPVRYDELSRRVIQQCVGVNPSVVLPALRKSVRDFAVRTEIWQYALDPIDIVAEQKDYNLTPDNWKASVLRVLEVKLLSSEEVSSGSDGAITPQQFYEFNLTDILTLNDQIKPHANVTGGLRVKVVLLPSLDAIEIDEHLFALYGDAMVAKAIYDIKGQLGRPWYDQNGRADFRFDYLRGVAAARGDLARGFGVGGGLEA